MKSTQPRDFQCSPVKFLTRRGVFVLGLLTLMPLTVQAQSPNPAPVTLVALGDSLTAGYLLPPSAAFPAQLQVALEAKGYKVQIINAGVSGDTTSGGLERIEWTLQTPADGVILELGANDALRGTDPKVPRENLDKILTVLKSKNVEVLLAGMRAPQNWGPDYVKAFDAIYPELAANHAVALYPFFLEGVALEPALVMQDGLHPTEKGVAEIVKRILPDVITLIQKISERRASASK